ncbi:hypothetical protein [Akkermansia sp.]|uniref:hypothetical protein n=1 Tax=Akkermansia sp. TaxID=1872421 RepID=UPI0025C56C67|nr:hypothetical protein [Akkermansia sp.]MCD8064087.1 hypothetical protein [Akkermansia sp.]
MNEITKVNGVLVAAQSDFASHTENKNMHLTEEERTAWNDKADSAALTDKVDTATFTAHETNTTVHITNAEREKWNARNTKGALVATQDGLDEHIEDTAVHTTLDERTAWSSGTEWALEVDKVMKITAPSDPSRTASLISQEGLALGAGARVDATGAGWAMGVEATCVVGQCSMALGHKSCVTGDCTTAVGYGAVCSSQNTMVISAHNFMKQINATLGLEVDNEGKGYLWVALFDHLKNSYSPGARISLEKFKALLCANGGEEYTPSGQACDGAKDYNNTGKQQ